MPAYHKAMMLKQAEERGARPPLMFVNGRPALRVLDEDRPDVIYTWDGSVWTARESGEGGGR